RDAKSGKMVSITQTRTALGSFVTNLKLEMQEEMVMNASDSMVADGTVITPDTAANLLEAGAAAENTSGNLLLPILSGLSLAVAAVLGYLYWTERQKRKKLESEPVAVYKTGANDVELKTLQAQVPQLIEKIKQYEKAIKEYERVQKENQANVEVERKNWLEKLQALEQASASVVLPGQSPAPIESVRTEIPKEEISHDVVTEAKPPVQEEFYLATPNKDGSFRDIRTVEFDPSQSLYRVKLIGPMSAEFEFVDDPNLVSEALRYPETFLDPVCEYAGSLQFGSRSITTIKKGRLNKSPIADRWELMTKAIIRFES
ncbi:MAG: hypothetical protein QM669_09130, partial [Siphonobacter sp.]